MRIIQIDHLTKEYKLGQFTSLKQTALNRFNRLIGRPVEKRKPFKALDDIHFSVEEGEVLDILGHSCAIELSRLVIDKKSEENSAFMERGIHRDAYQALLLGFGNQNSFKSQGVSTR